MLYVVILWCDFIAIGTSHLALHHYADSYMLAWIPNTWLSEGHMIRDKNVSVLVVNLFFIVIICAELAVLEGTCSGLYLLLQFKTGQNQFVAQEIQFAIMCHNFTPWIHLMGQ